MASITGTQSINIEYSYELTLPTANITYDGSSNTIIKFNENAVLTEKKNGVVNADYKGNTQIVNFLKSVNAVIFGHTDWTIGSINIKDHEDIFVKDETVIVGYSFVKKEVVNGKQVNSIKLINQNVNVSYYECSVSQNISTADNKLELENGSVTIDSDDFDIVLKYHQNANGNHSITEVSNYNTSLLKSTFSKTDSDLVGSNSYRDTITISTTNYSNVVPFMVYYNISAVLESVEIVGEDTNKYFVGKQNVFKQPTFSIKFTYSDNTTQTKSLSEIDNIVYYQHTNETTYNLTPNEDIIESNSEIELYFSDLDKSVYYQIVLQGKEITNVEIQGFTQIIYGSCLEDYEALYKAHITYDDNSTNNLSFEFTGKFKNMTYLPSSKDIMPKTNTLLFSNGEKYQYTLPTTFVQPTFIRIDVDNVFAIKDYSRISLGNIKLVYGVIGNQTRWEKTYEKTASFGTTLSKDTYTVSSSDFETNYLNGTNVCDKVVGEYTLTLTAQNPFFSGTTYQKNFTISVKNVNSIKKWNLTNIKYKYEVKEKFLNNDTTEVEMTFEEGKGNNKLSQLVSDGLFNIIPQKDYEFNSIEKSKKVQVKALFGDKETQEYFIDIYQNSVSSSTKIIHITAKYVAKTRFVEGASFKPRWVLIDEEQKNLVGNEVSGRREYGEYVFDDYIYGYLENVNEDTSKSSSVVLLKDFQNTGIADNNMIVKFPCYVEGNAEKINKATFGIMFGSDNYNNRLFVSGNEDYPNYDWHTADVTGVFNEATDNESVNNLTYFTDIGEQQYGSSDSKVVGYDIVSDSKLLVLKEKSDKDKTIYFRTPTYNEDDYENITEVFTVSKGNNSVAGISPHSIINFNGDTLFIDSDNTLQGLDLTGIQGDTQRYANSRSKLIDNLLKTKDLSNSILWSNNKYLLLTIDNYGTFITHYDTKGDTQYEWWLLNYDNPQCFIEVGNTIYYGNNNGALFKITPNKFVDIHKVYINKAEGLYITSIDPSNEKNGEQIILSQRIIDKVQKGDCFKHYVDESAYQNNIYKRVGSIGNSTTHDLYINNGEITVQGNEVLGGNVIERYIPIENETYYLNMLSGTTGATQINWVGHTSDFGVKFKFKYVYDENGEITKKVKLYRNGVECDVSQLVGADLCLRIEKDTEIKLVDNQNDTISLEGNADIVTYGSQNTQVELIKGEISHKENVSAYYITSPLLANIQYAKTLWQFTLANDSGLPSELSLCVSKNKMPVNSKQLDISYSTKDYNYDEIDYDKITFEDIDIPRVYTRYKVIPNLNFVCFALKNDNDTNCVLTSMAITYTIPFPQV